MTTVTCVLHHHIGEETVFESGLNVSTSRAAYEAQIDWLVRHHSVVSLDQLLSGALPYRPLLLTFDDAFRSVFEVARDVLHPRGLPSVFFVNPGLLEEGALSLDSALAWAVESAGMPSVAKVLDVPPRSSVSELIATDMARLGSADRSEMRDRLVSSFGPPDLTLRAPLISKEELRELGEFGVEIGNHTYSHVHCRSLSEMERALEIGDARERLEALSGQQVRAFSVPYGNEADLTPEVLETIRSSGHEAVFLVHARSNRQRPAPDIWYRTSLHDESPTQLGLVLKVKPELRSLKKRIMG